MKIGIPTRAKMKRSNLKPQNLWLAVVLGISVQAFSAAAANNPDFTPSQNRATVAAVATQIREQYFDADKAKQIANELEQQAAAGNFDQYRHGGELATALSSTLRAKDNHFGVLYSAAATEGAAPPTRSISRQLNMQRQNFGFKRVEILPGNIGYLALDQFANPGFDDPASAAKVAADNALNFMVNSSAVIIDLRQNGGGSPEMVGYLVSAFTAADAPIYNQFRQRQGSFSEAPSQFFAKPRLDVPLYLLISGRSASAAEGFSYTLQAAKRATVVGEASAGGANPGGSFPAGAHFSVFVSTGSPVNPITGSNWERTGVVPDVVVPSSQALTRAQQLAFSQLLRAQPTHPLQQVWRWASELLDMKEQPNIAATADYAGQYQDLTIALANNRLALHRGKRPPQYLQALRPDLFAIEGLADVRIRFDRDDKRQIKAAEFFTVDGFEQRFARNVDQPVVSEIK